MGIPEEYKTMGSVGGGFASFLMPGVQIVHNTAWINYIWYNQQRFINYLLGALGLIWDQLHATSLKAAQNCFILNQMQAPE